MKGSTTPARTQWRKGEVTDSEAKELAKKQRKDFRPVENPGLSAPPPAPTVPRKAQDYRPEDQWRKDSSDRRWQTWRRFPADKQILLWRDLEIAERHLYWTQMSVHERSTLWTQMSDEEKDTAWARMPEPEKPDFCDGLLPGERARWCSQFVRSDPPTAENAPDGKFKPARPEDGYTPKSNYIEIE